MPSSFPHDNEFNKLLSGREDVDLVRLMLEFAADAYTDLDTASCLAELDRLGDEAAALLSGRAAKHESLRARLSVISDLLYIREGFRGNTHAYYDPKNSYLNEVLSRRLGIPISLAIVHQAVAERAGVPMSGVATPGHFVLRCDAEGETLYVDAFSGGAILDRRACRAFIEKQVDEPASVRDEHFRPASAREIAARVLRNLKAAYVMEKMWQPALSVQERLAALCEESAVEGRDLGLILLRVGLAARALAHLERYASECGEAEREELAPYLRTARRMVAELN